MTKEEKIDLLNQEIEVNEGRLSSAVQAVNLYSEKVDRLKKELKNLLDK